jgi:hypothetical protein
LTQPQWIEVAYQILPQSDSQGYPVDHRAALALHPGRLPVIVSVALTLDGQGTLEVYHQTKPHGDECQCWEKIDTKIQSFRVPDEPTLEQTLIHLAKMTGQWLDSLKQSFLESQAYTGIVPLKGGFDA